MNKHVFRMLRQQRVVIATMMVFVAAMMLSSCSIISDVKCDTAIGTEWTPIGAIVKGFIDGLIAPIIWLYHGVMYFTVGTTFFFTLFHFQQPLYSAIFLFGSLFWFMLIAANIGELIENHRPRHISRLLRGYPGILQEWMPDEMVIREADRFNIRWRKKDIVDKKRKERKSRRDLRRVQRLRLDKPSQVEMLEDLALSNECVSVRRAAIAKIINQRVLTTIAKSEIDHKNKMSAISRVSDSDLLLEIVLSEPPRCPREINFHEYSRDQYYGRCTLAQVQAIKQITDQSILARIAIADVESFLRLTAISQLTVPTCDDVQYTLQELASRMHIHTYSKEVDGILIVKAQKDLSVEILLSLSKTQPGLLLPYWNRIHELFSRKYEHRRKSEEYKSWYTEDGVNITDFPEHPPRI